MGFQLQTKDFIRYFQEAREVIAAQRDYVTELDSTTGDGDHWVNVNMGFEKITALSKELEDMTLADMFKKVGMTMYSAVGGSSGALYGSGYMAAGRACAGKAVLDVQGLYAAGNHEAWKNRARTENDDRCIIPGTSCI